MKYFIGDNPFFGVNHRTGSKSLIDQDTRFNMAIDVIEQGISNGFSGLMISAHEEGQLLLEKYQEKLGPKNIDLSLQLVVPYPHTVNDLVAKYGYIGAVQNIMGSTKLTLAHDLIRLLFVSRKKQRKTLIKNYLLSEQKNFESKNIKIESFCLHNVFCDLFIGLRRPDLIIEFIDVSYEIGINPVLISQNPISVMNLETNTPYVTCFTYNSLGYMVNPSLDAVKEAIIASDRNTNNKLWAMQLLASGNISPNIALEDPFLNYFDGMLYATTKKNRILDFANKIKKHTLIK